MPICLALLKYGHSAFSVEILEYCDKDDTLTRENYYLFKFKPDYNIAKDASATFLGRFHSEETKAKLSAANSGEKHPMFGKSRSEETKAKLRAARLGEKHPLFGKTPSEETKAKISIAMRGNQNPVGKIVSDDTKAKIREKSLGRLHTEESKAKMSQNNTRKQTISVTNVQTGIAVEYSSLKEASESLKGRRQTISKYIKNNKLYKDIYQIEKGKSKGV